MDEYGTDILLDLLKDDIDVTINMKCNDYHVNEFVEMLIFHDIFRHINYEGIIVLKNGKTIRYSDDMTDYDIGFNPDLSFKELPSDVIESDNRYIKIGSRNVYTAHSLHLTNLSEFDLDIRIDSDRYIGYDFSKCRSLENKDRIIITNDIDYRNDNHTVIIVNDNVYLGNLFDSMHTDIRNPIKEPTGFKHIALDMMPHIPRTTQKIYTNDLEALNIVLINMSEIKYKNLTNSAQRLLISYGYDHDTHIELIECDINELKENEYVYSFINDKKFIINSIYGTSYVNLEKDYHFSIDNFINSEIYHIDESALNYVITQSINEYTVIFDSITLLKHIPDKSNILFVKKKDSIDVESIIGDIIITKSLLYKYPEILSSPNICSVCVISEEDEMYSKLRMYYNTDIQLDRGLYNTTKEKVKEGINELK